MRGHAPSHPDRAISALDAIITVGRSTVTKQFERRVAREIAGMIGGRIVFHRHRKRWLTLRPQAEHTLTTWSIIRLARVRRLRAIRIRHRPEFWRPEQRRPGGVLLLPLGEGMVCIGRRRPFGRREVAAVRTVLRFLAARLADKAAGPAATSAAVAVRAKRITLPSGDGLVGTSPLWRQVLRQVGRVAESTCSVLLVGETGTGKDVVARAIHGASLRSRFAFVPVNCGALSAGLLSSELFGHVRGAFTGADRTREGLFVRAHRGTLFLDEVADMPPEMQVALLRVLEDREVRPVGSVRTVPVDVRVVTASARDLVDEVEAGRFREDLFHRLNVVRIEVPPLRARKSDIPLLVTHLLARTSDPVVLHPDVVPLLVSHDWPGNVRELDNALRAATALADGEEITPDLMAGILAQRRLHRRGPTIAPPPSATPSVVGPRESALLSALETGWLSAPDLADRLGVSIRTVNRDLTGLHARCLVAVSGEARARPYSASAAPTAPIS